jgi:hypothetical protein
MALDSSRVINGQYGEVWQDGKWLTNVQSAEATVEINKEEIMRSGTRWVGHKVTTLKGSGTIKGYKVTSDFIKSIGSVASDRGKPFVTELIYKLDDPEAFGAERVRLKSVQFDQIPLGKFDVGAIVEEELPFTFTGYDLLDEIKEI